MFIERNSALALYKKTKLSARFYWPG